DMLIQQDEQQEQSQYMRFWSWLRALLLSSDFQATEAQASIAMMIVGMVLLSPHTTFTGPAYAPMANVMPEWAWGLALFWLGFLGMLAMIRRWFSYRRLILFAVACVWAFIGVMFFRSNPSGLGYWLFLVLAGSAGWAYWRLSIRGD
ncbi:MAG TPA: hypothetical protein VEF04_03105, partial [Blastocatellia bacterium]|nr:hypothetical protein [Blastocatellia bacterium]